MVDVGLVGGNIRAERARRGMTQQQLADAIKADKRAVHTWECGKNTPSMENLMKLADFFCVSLDELVGREF